MAGPAFWCSAKEGIVWYPIGDAELRGGGDGKAGGAPRGVAVWRWAGGVLVLGEGGGGAGRRWLLGA